MSRSFEVDVNPNIIKWARENAGWSIEEIASKLKTSIENYKRIESGIKKPTYRQLELLSKYFKRPLSVFFLPKPPYEKPIASSFRVLPKSENLYSKEFRLVLRKSRYYQSVARELMNAMGYDVSSPINKYSLSDSPKTAAQKERENAGISIEKQLKWENAYEAFNNWRKIEENILIFQFKFSLKDARGFCLMGSPPIIVINSSDNILARIFTLFHEYAHVLLGISEIYTEEIIIITDRKIEEWCDSFAAEFLIPSNVVKEDPDFQILIQLKENVLEILEELSRKYKVSKKAILVRLKTLNLISHKQYETFIQAIEEKSTEEKRTFFLSPEKRCIQEKGEKFISTVLEGKEKGIITTHEAIEYLSIKLKYIDKIQKLLIT